MQHVPIPSTAERHLLVPYLWGYIYDNGNWIDFPGRFGWDINKFLQGNFQPNDVLHSGTVDSLLQAWLYFGFMAEVTGAKIEIRDFIENTDGQDYITTSQLPELINTWQDRVEDMSVESQRLEALRIDEFLKSSRVYFVACVDDDLSYPDVIHCSPLPLSAEVRLSVSILYTTLCLAKSYIFSSSKFLPPGFDSGIVRTRLLGAGWCESDIELLYVDKQNHAILEGYYSSLLGPRQNPKSHVDCNSRRCIAFDTDDENYEVKHLQSCQGCLFVETDMVELCNIYRETLAASEASIPLLRVIEASGEALKIEVTRSTPRSRYVAFSHVFGDGLGNPKRCALPACQLSLLQKRADQALECEKAFFWMDSLCVPQQPQFKEVKRVGLIRMKKTYEDAAIVLVLNAELNGTSVEFSTTEILTRIATNSWFRRLWTLQEGFLAKKLRFQLQDGAVDADTVVRELLLTTSPRFTIESRLRRSAAIPLQRLKSFQELFARAQIWSSPGELVWHLFSLAYWRSTSHPADEGLVLSTLLGFHPDHVAKIVAAPDSEKMRQLVLVQRCFPVDVLFFQDPRMDCEGFGWCLRTFMSRLYTDPIDPYSRMDFAEADEQGLHMSSSGIVFSPNSHHGSEGDSMDFGFKLSISDQSSGSVYRIETGLWLRNANKPSSWDAVLRLENVATMALVPQTWPLAKEDRLPSPSLGGLQDLVSTLSFDPSEFLTMASEGVDVSAFETSLMDMQSLISEQQAIKVTEKPTVAALLSCRGQGDGGEMVARFCGVVTLAAGSVRDKGDAVTGVVLDKGQKWCIQ